MSSLNAEKLARAKSLGFSDRQIAHLTGSTEDAIRAERKRIGLRGKNSKIKAAMDKTEAINHQPNIMKPKPGMEL